MRYVILVIAALTLMSLTLIPAAADNSTLDGPASIWLSDPEGVDGTAGIEQGDVVAGASGHAVLKHHGANIQVRTTGLVPGHAYTMWIAYFNDKTQCAGARCAGSDRGAAGGGVLYGAGTIAGGDGAAVFTTSLKDGAGEQYLGQGPPPPFAVTAYEAGLDNEFHMVIRSHGPLVPGAVRGQTSTFGGGCEVNVGPTPGQVGDFPVPVEPGECGDVQLFIFG